MKPLGFFLCICLAACCFACQAVSVRAVHETFEAEFEFDGVILGVDTGKYDVDMDITRTGVELAAQSFLDLEFFVDVSGSEIENDDTGIDADGIEVGAGLRSPWPKESGWGLDFGARLSYHDTENDFDFAGVDIDDEMKGYGLDVHLGPYYAMELEKDFLLSPRAGILFKGVRGDEEADGPGIEVADLDYDHYSVAGYIGFRLSPKAIKMFDVTAHLYLGSHELKGAFIAAGIRF